MTIVDVKTVPCPCCKKTLYRDTLMQRDGAGDAVWLTTPESPRVENNKEGYFITCLHCSKRVVMLPNPEHPNAGYYVSPVQQC